MAEFFSNIARQASGIGMDSVMGWSAIFSDCFAIAAFLNGYNKTGLAAVGTCILFGAASYEIYTNTNGDREHY